MKDQNLYSDETYRRYQLISEELLSCANQEDEDTDHMYQMLVRDLDEYTKRKEPNNTYQYNWDVGTTFDQSTSGEMKNQFDPSSSTNDPLEDLLDPTTSPSSFLSAQEVSDFFESFEHHKENVENNTPGTSNPKIPPPPLPQKECSVCFTNKTTKWRRGMFLEQLCSPCYMYESRNGKRRPQELCEATYQKVTEVLPKVPKKRNRPPPTPKQCSNCYTNKCSTWRRGRNWERLCSNCWMYDVAHPGEKRPQELIETTFRRNTGFQYPYGAPAEVPIDLKRPCLKCQKKEAKRRNMCMKCYDAERWLEKLKKRKEKEEIS